MFQQEDVLQQCCETKEQVHDVLVKINTGRKGGKGAVEEQLFRDFSEKLDVVEFMRSDGIHLKVMKKTANAIVRLLPVNHHGDLGEVPDGCKKADVTPVC